MQKYKIHITKAENNKCIYCFGLTIPISTQKCLNNFDFQNKVKITAHSCGRVCSCFHVHVYVMWILNYSRIVWWKKNIFTTTVEKAFSQILRHFLQKVVFFCQKIWNLLGGDNFLFLKIGNIAHKYTYIHIYIYLCLYGFMCVYIYISVYISVYMYICIYNIYIFTSEHYVL